MTLDKFLDYFKNENDNRPNKITKHMGEAIRKAREEKGISQAELARIIYRRRATLSDIENGKTEPDASTLAMLAHTLEKPFGYFYPVFIYRELKQEDLTPLENELLIQFRNIWGDQLRKLSIQQIKSVVDFKVDDLIIENIEKIAEEIEMEENVEKLLRDRKKKKNSLDNNQL
jgi:transcriptional regulator with XRE-family HTH domain